MIALKVSVNGKHRCTAGAEDMGVLGVNVSAIGLLGSQSKRSREDETVEYHVHIGGLTSRKSQPDDNLSWAEGIDLSVGGRVEVEICDLAQADPPQSTSPSDERRAEERLKEQFEYAKAFYLQFRDRFET